MHLKWCGSVRFLLESGHFGRSRFDLVEQSLHGVLGDMDGDRLGLQEAEDRRVAALGGELLVALLALIGRVLLETVPDRAEDRGIPLVAGVVHAGDDRVQDLLRLADITGDIARTEHHTDTLLRQFTLGLRVGHLVGVRLGAAEADGGQVGDEEGHDWLLSYDYTCTKESGVVPDFVTFVHVIIIIYIL